MKVTIGIKQSIADEKEQSELIQAICKYFNSCKFSDISLEKVREIKKIIWG